MDPVLNRYASRATPRYTSYPTAPHFQTGFTDVQYRSWLAEVDTTTPVSLYLHVPFCRQMCWYCGCNMKLAAKYAPIAEYAQTLRKEIALTADALPERTTLSHLHWGGGTPTALSPDDLEVLMTAVRARWDFAPDAEVAIESAPRTLPPGMAIGIGRLGFTRASFGVQEFDIRVQKAINRVQPPAMVRRSVDQLRAAGVSGINFDLIYGLPFQTVQSLVETVEISVSMRPDRVALFGYAHVPWMAKNQRMIPDTSLPGANERTDQAEAAAEALLAQGYVAIGLDHFALPDDALAVAAQNGTLRRNFQGYTDDPAEVLIGIGASSISRFPQGFAQNNPSTSGYHQTVRDGGLATVRGHAFTAEDKVREAKIGKLMCDFAIDFNALGKTLGLAPSDLASRFDGIEEVFPDILDRDGARIEIKPAGRPLTRMIARYLDTYAAGQTGHSAAI